MPLQSFCGDERGSGCSVTVLETIGSCSSSDTDDTSVYLVLVFFYVFVGNPFLNLIVWIIILQKCTLIVYYSAKLSPSPTGVGM